MNDRYFSENEEEKKLERTSGRVEIDLMDLAKDIWRAKYTLCAAVVFAVLFSLVTLAFAKRSYTAIAVVAPAESSPQSGLSSSISQLAGAASMLGVDVGAAGSPNAFSKFKSLLTSQALAEELFQNDALKPTFFGPAWVPQTRSWKRPTGFVFEIKDFTKGILGLQQWQTPSAFDLQDDLKLHLGMLPDKVTGYVTLSIQEETPQDALFILKSIIGAADTIIRRDVKNIAINRIVYLDNALQKTSLQDQRQALIAVLSAQEKNVMMASADKFYSIDLIDPPSASPIPTAPRPSSTIVNNVLIFLSLIAAWAVIRAQFFVRGSGQHPAKADLSLDSAIKEWLRRKLKAARGAKWRTSTYS